MRGYTQDLRNKAIKLYLTGNYTKKSLSELLIVDYKTLRSWIIANFLNLRRLVVKDYLMIRLEY